MARYALIVEQGATPGTRFELDTGACAVIGRERDVLVRISEQDKSVSRHHAVLEVRGDGVVVRDLGSRHGTFVDDVAIQEGFLRAGCRLRVGRTVMRLDDHAAPVEGTELADAGAGASFQMAGTDTRSSSQSSSWWLCGSCQRPSPQWGAPAEGYAWLCDTCADERRRARRPGDPERLGSFEVLRGLAVGGMGVVYEARDARTFAHAAVKVLLPDSPLGAQAIGRFLREQRIAWGLVHPRIVLTFEAAQAAEGGQLYIASEFVPGGEAVRLMHPRGDDRSILSVSADLFEALAYGHTQGIVHRDVKPQNLLVTRPDASGLLRAKLNDYGIAKNWSESGATSITKAGMIAGSLLFMSPEQWIDFKRAGPGADIYSAAASTYYLLTGAVPQTAPHPPSRASVPQLLAAALDDERIPIRTRRPDLPAPVADLLDVLVCRDPKQRAHVTAADAARVLRAAVG